MFRTNSQQIPAGVALAAATAEKNYVIQKNDLLEIRLFSSKGEELINDNINQNPIAGNAAAGVQNADQRAGGLRFLVEDNGMARLPQIGPVKLEGLTLHQADSLLENVYNNYYVEPFVETKFINKRVIILGATTNQVVTLQHENMNLIEVLALAGGVSNNGKVGNIRLIRGDLSNPEVYLIDLSTIDGMKKSNLRIQSHDIIYVEPVRKPFVESVADISPIISIVTGLVSFVLVIVTLTK